MRKIIQFAFLFVITLMSFTLTGCSAHEEPPTPITCNIKFAKTVNEKYEVVEWYDEEQNEFEINTKIYVIVDFVLINNGNNDDFVDFKVQIPYAKYYSTHEYKKGVVEPKEDYKTLMNPDGTSEEMVELSDMVFNVKMGQIPFSYTYCFVIEGNQICENVEFRAVFISNTGAVISNNQTFSKSYSFILNQGGVNNEE